MEHPLNAVQVAVEKAVVQGKLIFAAAANSGGLMSRAYPAKFNGVVCVHATDGQGNPAEFNPDPGTGVDNFATAGVAIGTEWKGKETNVSGTFYAVPVAAGIAANILDLAHTRLTEEEDRLHVQSLYRYSGMRSMLSWMSRQRGGYDNLRPWILFPPREGGVMDSHIDEAYENIRKAMLYSRVPEAWRSKT
ncbi:hypothetical protein CDD83_9374 [Cordyceps sp. RAO-2017]|nr:hypothetical protein CDD83_9374 [Cordyceps sp. RAO-2017]